MIVSIDCWGTLLKGSPTFNQAKIQLVKKYFNEIYSDVSIQSAFDITKMRLNDIIENSGGIQPTSNQIFTFLFSKLMGYYTKWRYLPDFIKEYQELALTHPPVIYSSDTKQVFENISKIAHIVISSNTMFVSGETLKQVLMNMGLGKLVTTFHFSDEMGVAKPNKLMYFGSDFHIGDNYTTDLTGATLAGSKGILIHSNNKTIRDAYDIILQ